MIEKLIKKNKIYSGLVVDFFCDKVKPLNGIATQREYLKHPGAAAVVPFIDKKNIILVRQYRYPINQITYEIPAGKIEKNEKPIECVMRELEEETGYKSKKIKNLLSFYPTTAFSTEVIYIFVAFDLKKGKENQDKDELISRETISFIDANKMIRAGKIKDSKTIIALLYLENILEDIYIK
jgi:ADP-ribose pyrophosphatase